MLWKGAGLQHPKWRLWLKCGSAMLETEMAEEQKDQKTNQMILWCPWGDWFTMYLLYSYLILCGHRCFLKNKTKQNILFSTKSTSLLYYNYEYLNFFFDLWPPKSNLLILESKWMFVPNFKKFPQGITELSHSHEWNGQTNSPCGCRHWGIESLIMLYCKRLGQKAIILSVNILPNT